MDHEATKVLRLMSSRTQIGWTFIDQGMVSGVNFLTGVLLARYLGLKEFGIFSLTWMIVLFANSIQYALIISPMMSIGPKKSEAEAPSYYGAALFQQILFSGCVFILLLIGIRIVGYLFPEWNIIGLGIPVALTAVAFQLQDFNRRLLFTERKIIDATINDGVRYLGQLTLLTLLLQKMKLGTAEVLWIIAIPAFFAAAIGLFNFRKFAWDWEIISQTAKRHWHFARWLTAAAFLQWLTGNFLIVAAGGFLGVTVVGAIKAAQNILGISHVLFQGLENIVVPRAAKEYEQSGMSALQKYLGRVALWAGIPMTVFAFSIMVWPRIWMGLFYGDEFINYSYLLKWYALAYIIMFIGLLFRTALRSIEQTLPILNSYIFMSIFSVVSAYSLIKWFELEGVMFGILMVNVIMVASLAFSINAIIKVGWRSTNGSI